MSKRWQLPTQKGTEVNPQTTRQPPKLVIPGVGGDPNLRARVVSEYGGQLARFHVGQMQKYALSTSPVMGGHHYLPDAKMSYWNNNGQETLRLEVAPQKLEQLKKPPPVRGRWDWALIELWVPNVVAADLQVIAQLKSPMIAHMDVGSELPFPALATNTGIFFTMPLDKYINAPKDPFVNVLSRSSTDQYASFMVDLRPLQGLPSVTVELHAAMISFKTLPTVVPGWGSYPTTPWPPDTFGGMRTDDISSFPSGPGVDHASWWATLPEYAWSEANGRWQFVSSPNFVGDSPPGTSSVYTLVTPPPSMTLLGGTQIIWGLLTQDNGLPGYTGVTPSPAEVQVTMFRGRPNLSALEYIGAGATFGRWVFDDTDSQRPGHTVIARNPLDVIIYTDIADNTLHNYYGLPSYGVVTLPVVYDPPAIPGPSFEAS